MLRLLVAVAFIASRAASGSGTPYLPCDRRDPAQAPFCGVGDSQAAVASSGNTAFDVTQDGIQGWTDLPLSVFTRFSQFLLNVDIFVPPMTAVPRKLTFGCSQVHLNRRGFPSGGCDAFMWQYRCPSSCPAAGRGSALGQQLLAKDWEIIPCSSYFNLGGGSEDYRFVVYHKELAADEEVSVTWNEDVSYIFWGKRYKKVACSSNKDEPSCEAHSDVCSWSSDAGSCNVKTCQRPVGPFPVLGGGGSGGGSVSLDSCALCA